MQFAQRNGEAYDEFFSQRVFWGPSFPGSKGETESIKGKVIPSVFSHYQVFHRLLLLI